MGLASLPLRALMLAASASGLQFAQRAPAVARSREVVMMGRKFENNKMKMAKTALAFAKKASYIGKKVIIVVKDGGDDPVTNLQLAAVMREANALNVPKDVRSTASPPHSQPQDRSAQASPGQAKPNRAKTRLAALQAEGATQSSFYMVIYMQLSATHELQSATQKPLKGCLSCAELRLSCA